MVTIPRTVYLAISVYEARLQSIALRMSVSINIGQTHVVTTSIDVLIHRQMLLHCWSTEHAPDCDDVVIDDAGVMPRIQRRVDCAQNDEIESKSQNRVAMRLSCELSRATLSFDKCRKCRKGVIAREREDFLIHFPV